MQEKQLIIVLITMLDEPTPQLKEGIMKRKTTYGQHRSVVTLMIITLVLTLAGVQGSVNTASADGITFPEGIACADFALNVETTGSWPQIYKEFVDKDGNLICSLLAGKGVDFVFTNVSTGVTFSLKGTGSVAHYLWNPDGSYIFTGTGQNVMILFPTDPGGPSTTEYVGKVSVTSDAEGSWSPLETSGRANDICAALK